MFALGLVFWWYDSNTYVTPWRDLARTKGQIASLEGHRRLVRKASMRMSKSRAHCKARRTTGQEQSRGVWAVVWRCLNILRIESLS